MSHLRIVGYVINMFMMLGKGSYKTRVSLYDFG